MSDTPASASTSAASTAKPFPVKCKVVLHGLKAAEFNGKIGVVQGPVNEEGRQSVFVEELNKTVKLKMTNLKYQPRPLDSLSNKELKNILRFKQAVLKFQGMDKSDLQAALKEITEDELEIAEALALANAGGGGSSDSPDAPATDSSSGGADPIMDQFDSMKPELMLQQARMMKAMPFATVRKMNPVFANMTDAQILETAEHLENMATNPAVMEKARQHMKNMTPVQKKAYEHMVAQQAGAPPAITLLTPQERLANMTPEILRQQVRAMRSTPKEIIRQSNPLYKNMTDHQLDQTAFQMELLASNPEYLKMATEEMKKLSPQELEERYKATDASDLGSAMESLALEYQNQQQQQQVAMDPAKMLETMEPKQIKEMLNMLKNNPEMLNQMAAQSGMPKDGLEKMLNMFADMSDDQLESSLKTMAKVQKFTQGAKNLWQKGDNLVGGNLKIVLVAGGILLLVLILLYVLGGESPEVASKTATKIIQDNIPLSTPTPAQNEAVPEVEDEFSEL